MNFERDERFPGLEDGYYCLCAELLEIYFCIGKGDCAGNGNAVFFYSLPSVRSRDDGPPTRDVF